jgi:hypothetical protein
VLLHAGGGIDGIAPNVVYDFFTPTIPATTPPLLIPMRFSLWQIKKDAAPVLIFMEKSHNRTIMAVDIDNDNFPELFIEDRAGSYFLYKKVDGKWEQVYSWSVPDQDYPC